MRILVGFVVVIWRLVLEMCDEEVELLEVFRERMGGW
jgi:hypothetical protein